MVCKVRTYKARIVVKGFSQSYKEDYNETFASVVKHESIRALLCVAAKKKLHVWM